MRAPFLILGGLLGISLALIARSARSAVYDGATFEDAGAALDPFVSDDFGATGDAVPLLDPWAIWQPMDGSMSETPSSGATVQDASGLTRGERNNNPGNIVKSDIAWQGEVIGSDGRFEVFSSPEAGVRALAKLLRGYSRYGLRTVRQIITRYAPPSENNTSAYVLAVSRDVGVTPDAPLDLSNANTLAALVSAIITHENGRNIYPPDMIAAVTSAVAVA